MRLRLHPLFLLVGAWYAFTGELFLFLMSCLVALQHECAHAFAAAKLGYKLNRIVLMPFGAVIDGDLRGISLKDEIYVAICGPLCNLVTAAFFVAVWWCYPATYPYTDSACYSSLTVALVNLIPAYPLDGGRILKCALVRALSGGNTHIDAEKRADGLCRAITLFCAAALFVGFATVCVRGENNLTLLCFGIFLLVGAFGNRDKTAVYDKMDFSCRDALRRGTELRRIAVLATCPVKNVLRYVSSGSYLVLEVFDEKERHLFDLPQNELSELFLRAPSPYTPLGELVNAPKKG